MRNSELIERALRRIVLPRYEKAIDVSVHTTFDEIEDNGIYYSSVIYVVIYKWESANKTLNKENKIRIIDDTISVFTMFNFDKGPNEDFRPAINVDFEYLYEDGQD